MGSVLVSVPVSTASGLGLVVSMLSLYCKLSVSEISSARIVRAHEVDMVVFYLYINFLKEKEEIIRKGLTFLQASDATRPNTWSLPPELDLGMGLPSEVAHSLRSDKAREQFAIYFARS